jgi:hypothetical protein
MVQRKQINNKIFTSAFAAVILLIISFAVSILAIRAGHTKDIPYIISFATSGVAALTLLSYAVKKDNQRRQMDIDFQ